jgi:hypothetical protein
MIKHANEYYMHDPRIDLMDNTGDAAAIASASSRSVCLPSAPKTFLNKDTCVRQLSCVTPIEYSAETLTLDEATLRSFYTTGHKFAYQIQGLRLENTFDVSPCEAETTSRWRKNSDGACTEEGGVCATGRCELDATTRASIVAALESSTDTNPYVRDLQVTGDCAAFADGTSTTGAIVTADGACWEHVHPSLFDVMDFTYWTEAHPNMNKQDLLINPISMPAGEGGIVLAFPGHHGMTRWSDVYVASKECSPKPGVRRPSAACIVRVGRFGDIIPFTDLPGAYQTPELAALIGATSVGGGVYDGSETCGSPGEVASDSSANHLRGFYLQGYQNSEFIEAAALQQQWDREVPVGTSDGKTLTWVNTVFDAPDQLRQRVAWALSQIYVISEATSGTVYMETEVYTAYYDIFVRNAFGNVRDILREVAYSPMMGHYLTFQNSKSFAASGSYPDENFARELFELFSVGLYELNEDGTRKVDADGHHINTFTNSDILNFARVWTGFSQNLFRTNFENRLSVSTNQIDPMQIQPLYRDALPKSGLRSGPRGYIGDSYPLCTSLPERAFLRRGARYTYRGTTVPDSPGTLGVGSWGKIRKRLAQSPRSTVATLAAESLLHEALCSADAQGECQFPSEVHLTRSLSCTGVECDVDTATVVAVPTGEDMTVYYEYIPQPCVWLTFYPDAKQIKIDLGGASSTQVMCADPKAAAAAAACCPTGERLINGASRFGESTGNAAGPGLGVCEYKHEMVTFATAQARCEATPEPRYVNGPWLYDYVDTIPTEWFMASVPDGSSPSMCMPKTIDSQVKGRCCSDTRVEAMDGDVNGQNYK